MKRTAVKALAIAIGLVLTATACSKGDDSGSSSGGKSTITLSLWNYEKTPEFKALIDGFKADNPDIDVQYVDILADNYSDKLTTMLAGGDQTDVLTMKNVTDYARYATRGQLASLTDEAKKLDQSKYRGLDAFDLKGEYYALPYRNDFWLLYYNKTMLKDAGADLSNLTWSEYDELAKKLTKGDGANKVYGTYHHVWRSVVQAIASAQTGGDQLTGDYQWMKDQYTMALDVQKAGATVPWATANTQKISYQTMFGSEKTALLPMGTWYAASLLADISAGKSKVDWGLAPMPQISKNGKVTTFGSPTAFAVNKKAKNAKAAKTFVNWATGPKGAAAIAKIGITPSYSDQTITDAYFSVKGMPADDLSKKAFQPTTVKLEMPVSDKSSDVDTILKEEHQLIMTGEKSLDAGIAEMAKRVKSEVS